MIKVLEVDQWTATGNVDRFSFNDFSINDVRGGDSEASRLIGAASGRFLEVREHAEPPKGRVWFIEDINGRFVRWKSNYDSSD